MKSAQLTTLAIRSILPVVLRRASTSVCWSGPVMVRLVEKAEPAVPTVAPFSWTRRSTSGTLGTLPA